MRKLLNIWDGKPWNGISRNLDDNKNMYDFTSLKCLPPVNKMENFESRLLLMVKNIEFKNVKNEFQEILKEGINNEIKTSDKIFVVAGKSRHL